MTVPADVADEVLSLAEEKVATEDVVRTKLADGVAVQDIFAAHGVL